MTTNKIMEEDFMLAAVRAVISGVAKYGGKAVSWAKNNIGQIRQWITDGMSVDWIIDKIGGMFS